MHLYNLTFSLNETTWLSFRSNRAIVEDIGRGEGNIYGAELLKDLLKLLPDSEEVCLYIRLDALYESMKSRTIVQRQFMC